MTRLSTKGGRGGDAPADRLRRFARRLAEFADRHCETLSFDDWANLAEHETRLLAYSELLAADNATRLIESGLAEAADYLRYAASRIGVSDKPGGG